ncbi:MAG TPA: DUF350 domain-containing protein, partial [Gammaproteobacteria bacterium]|nr:DUF350 domain-containing protein [Gammaproteobacteria bacterium]
MENIPLINFYPDLLAVLLVDLIIAITLLTVFRKLAGLISNVSSTQELAEKDNFAFGLVFAGGMGALAIVLTGAISGDPGHSLFSEIVLVITYGVLGIALMTLTRKILDKFTLPNIDIQDQVMKGNMAAAIADVGNLIATAIIVRAVMVWIDDSTLFGLVAVIIGFVVSQLVLIMVTKYRSHVYAKRHNGDSLQKAFEAGNQALAIRYLGHKIGVALAVTAASGFVPYNDERIIMACLAWGLFSLLLTIVLSLIAMGARHIILAKINVVEEVDKQKNLGIAYIEAMIYIAIGFLLSGTIA